MAHSPLSTLLALNRPLLFDGGMGTMLQAAGMPAGMTPERFCLERPEVLLSVHKAYLEAGADIIITCTFGASIFKLDSDLDVYTTCKTLAQIARTAASEAGRPVCVAGDVGPSGHFSRPLGDLDPVEHSKGFEAQIAGLADGGCDLILIETQFDLGEARAAVVAARHACNLPVFVSMTFEEGTSLTGSTPEIFAETMQNLGVAALGTNCSVGPESMGPIVERLLKVSAVPVFAEPNAGMPQLQDGKTVFPLAPEPFARCTAPFAGMGARMLGGCCGTTPAHIAALKQALESDGYEKKPVAREEHAGIVLTSRQQLVRVGQDAPFALIGERINPTGKKQLTAELQQGSFALACAYADEQVRDGAAILDVNVGAHNVNQVEMLPSLVSELAMRHTIPVSLDSSDDKALLAAMPWCPGSSLVNSINGAKGRMELLGAACRDYGMPFILLPMRDARLPVQATERIAILEELLCEAEALNIPRRLMMVDVLALAISSKSEGAVECLKLLDWCRANHFATTIGLSNISFGLPARELINAGFLLMAAGAGLTSCIANPGNARIREAVASVQLLLDKDDNAEGFIARYADWKSGSGGAGAAGGGTGAGSGTAGPAAKQAATTPGEAVLQGDRDHVIALIDAELAQGRDPFALVNDELIAAITRVGTLYEKKVYFLPQLIRSAETMKMAFAHVRPLLTQDSAEERPTIVLATVEGDVHDIGKNIVGLLLSNHGFTVVDAGKDVPAQDIIETAIAHKASIIGLSALMTTTMVRMEDTIRMVRERKLPFKVMVGGAAVTKSFAEAIGADGYSVDAVECVELAKRLTGQGA